MTAEIAVMNKLGIALATDSAASIGRDESGKVYASADKLFPLADDAPVAIMVYGNAEFLGMPWETVIKVYRKQLGDKTFKTVSGYAKKFLQFIESNEDMRKYLAPKNSESTEIVFAGFGESEYMPVLLEFEITRNPTGKLSYRPEKKEEITNDNSATIIAFAQHEIVSSFMRGIHPALDDFIVKTTEKLFVNIFGAWFNRDNPTATSKQRDHFINDAHKQIEMLFHSWRDKSDKYWLPIINMVQFMPKDEMASMAEMLVNLTKFRQRISPDRETVGGPIDVALITKGDGFVWVKRKNYFPAEINTVK